MKFSLDARFDKLEELRREMGAEKSGWKSKVMTNTLIDLKLIDGVVQSIEELKQKMVATPEGLLTYEGRLVTLHIRETSYNDNLPRFHIANCSTLNVMEKNRRSYRFVMTHNPDGFFQVKTSSNDKKHPLKVCQNCLRKLNYEGFEYLAWRSKEEAVASFSLTEFFEKYTPLITHKTKYTAKSYPIGDGKDGYTKDFSIVSRRYREKQEWRCEKCGKDCQNDKKKLHSHHINGVKADNNFSNLQALCAECHKKMPLHGHMR